MRPMTAQQLTSICRVFTDGDNIAPTCQIQNLLDSGCLADLRDANFRRMEPLEFRNRIREVCDLPPMDEKGQVEHIVDCDKYPFLPQYWKVESHQEQGKRKLTRDGDHLFLDGKRIEPHLSPNQAEEKSIRDEKLREELKGKSVLNVNVLDYLLKHQELIPESWRKDEQGRTKYIFFRGTIYRDSHGDLCARYLYWRDGRWGWGSGWHVDSPTAVLAEK